MINKERFNDEKADKSYRAGSVRRPFTLPLASCGGSGDKDLPTIGIIQFAVHSSLDNCYEGLIKGAGKGGL